MLSAVELLGSAQSQFEILASEALVIHQRFCPPLIYPQVSKSVGDLDKLCCNSRF